MSKIKDKILLNLVALISFTGAFFYVGYVYLLEEITLASEEIISSKKELNNYNVKNERLFDLKEGYDKVRGEMDNVSDVIVDSNDTVNFIEKMESIASSDGVKLKIKSVSSSVLEKEEYISEKYFNITVGGDFENIIRFLYDMENFEYYIDMENINFSMGDFDQYNKELILLDSKIIVYQKEDEN